jgi:hypothetical protein
MRTSRLIRASVSLLALLTTVLLFVAGCSQKPRAPSGNAVTPAAEVSRITGNEACAECHAAEMKSHAATGHAHALHIMNEEELGSLAPPEGRIPDSEIVLNKQEGRYMVQVAGEDKDLLHLNLAWGSGKTGMTYVAFIRDGTMLELRKSYFPSTHQWYLTPGQDKKPRVRDVGQLYSAERLKRCVLCHATVATGELSELKPELFGVGCESCHGAGSKHVDAMHAANALDGTKKSPPGTKVYMEKMGSWPATQLNELCGKCHRAPPAVNKNSIQVNMTNRFQPYGLMISRCFKESGGKLSCVTCHNPHDNASKDLKGYEAACLKCHTQPEAEHTALKASATAKSCPVSPKTGCIPCHMPSRQVFEDTSLPTKMADHKIAIHKGL